MRKSKRASAEETLAGRRQFVLRHAEDVIHGATCLECGLMGTAVLALALADWELADLITADLEAQAGLEPLHG